MQINNRDSQAAILNDKLTGLRGHLTIDRVATSVARGGAHLIAGTDQGNGSTGYLAYGLQNHILGGML